MNQSRSLQPELVELINEKAAVECGQTALMLVSTYIKQLNDHIAGVTHLSPDEISAKLDYFIGCTTITLELPVNDLELLRARRSEDDCFSSLNELSYIKMPTAKFPKQGRLNKAGEVLFYPKLAPVALIR
ncbi:hypothetical protein TUM4433_04830 [Shewanella schlegeliana]|nr:hypothetical protein TUM4433_04830 [Shewanella schlegeliana]